MLQRNHINPQLLHKVDLYFARHWFERENNTINEEIDHLQALLENTLSSDEEKIKYLKQLQLRQIQLNDPQHLTPLTISDLTEEQRELLNPKSGQSNNSPGEPKLFPIDTEILRVRLELSEYYEDTSLPQDDMAAYYKRISLSQSYDLESTKPSCPACLPPEDYTDPLLINSPRYRYLLYKYNYFLLPLKYQINRINEKFVNQLHPEPLNKPIEEITGESRRPIKVIFDIGKKFIDIIDDIWSVLRSALPSQIFSMVGPFLTGGIGFIINTVEAYQGAKEAWQASKNKTVVGQWKTRLWTGATIFLLGCVGTGLSLAFIISAFGLAVSGAALMPALIPIFLLSIYTISLYKRSYIFHQSIQKEIHAKNELHDFVKTDIDAKIKNSIISLNDNADYSFITKQITWEAKKANRNYYRDERLKAERNVAFNVIEVTASAIVLIGTIMGLSALIGAVSFATMGVAPLIVLIIGVSIGLFCKAFEGYNEKRNFKYTDDARIWIVDTWNTLLNRSKMAKTNIFSNSTAHVLNIMSRTSTSTNTLPSHSLNNDMFRETITLDGIKPEDLPSDDDEFEYHHSSTTNSGSAQEGINKIPSDDDEYEYKVLVLSDDQEASPITPQQSKSLWSLPPNTPPSKDKPLNPPTAEQKPLISPASRKRAASF